MPSSKTTANPELEKTIAQNIADPNAYLVYADWLQGEGDVRGELIAVQRRLLEAHGDIELLKAEAKLLEENVAHFFGGEESQPPKRDQLPSYRRSEGTPAELWSHGHFRFDWFCGFVRAAWFEPGYYGEDKTGEECVAILARFLHHPSARFLREIYVGDIWDETYEGPDLELAAEVIAQSPIAAQLEVMEFIGGDHDISGVQCDARPLLKSCRRLKRLALYGGQMTVGEIELPELEKFAAKSGGLTEENLKDIANAKWPELKDLEIWFGSSSYGASGGVEEIQPILEGRGLKKLKRLGLMNGEFADALCDALIDAPILKQLEHLDLSMGILTEVGARKLLDHPKQLAHLKSLNLDRNFIDESLHEELKKLCGSVNIGRQEQDHDYRYVAVGE